MQVVFSILLICASAVASLCLCIEKKNRVLQLTKLSFKCSNSPDLLSNSVIRRQIEKKTRQMLALKNFLFIGNSQVVSYSQIKCKRKLNIGGMEK